MKIARFSHQGREGLGLAVPGGLVDIAGHLPDAPPGMIALIERFDALRPALAALETAPADFALGDVTLLTPVRRPGKIMGMGLNYADHVAEAGMEMPADQVWFSKAVTAINDPFGVLRIPRVSDALDYEAELVMVIGRKCRYVPREQALSVVFGYCVGNDATIRDWQFKTSQFVLGKSFDTLAPVGPWIATGDTLDPAALDIELKVNGEVRQRSNTRHFIFDCAAMIEHVSKVMTLEPGDLIFTGTPGGVGVAMKPPRWLKTGDVVRVEIEGIGAIENTVAPDA